MDFQENRTTASASALLSWLGLARDDTSLDCGPDIEVGSVSDGSLNVTPDQSPADANADLLAQISGFLLSNNLAISARNLKVAHDIFAGRNLQLAQKVKYRTKLKQPITQDWIYEVTGRRGEASTIEQYHDTINRLETDLEAFAETKKGAYCSSAAYGAHLARHASEMGNSFPADKISAEVASLTKAMLERTRRVEEEMRRSETEAASLRRSLAVARHDAEVDHLTQLPNRRAFEGILAKQAEEAKRRDRPLSLAFCDIDNFKQVNDSHGHEAGDRIICAVAGLLSRGSGKTCHVARHGGEEFVMLFVGLTDREARDQLDAIREKLERRHFVNRATEQPIGQITFSGGVADVTAFEDPRDALAAADSALYFAKDEGRNRICLAS